MPENYMCGEHDEAIKTLKKSDADQWKEINAMKTRSTIMLTTVIITLLGVITNLIVLLAR